MEDKILYEYENIKELTGDFAKNAQGLCPGRDSGFTELEISSSVIQDKITLTKDSRKNIGQIIEGLKILGDLNEVKISK